MSSPVGEKQLLRNAARCSRCGDTIESRHRHDWVSCSCGAIFVDGGLDYLRRGATDMALFIDMSETGVQTDEG